MNKLSDKIKEQALRLREKGYSLTEISSRLNIAKSTSSLWLRNVILNKDATKRLNDRIDNGHRKAALIWKNKKAKETEEQQDIANETIERIKKDEWHNKLYCALLYWCEGGKGDREVLKFTNSDPELIKIFLGLLRKSFQIKEEKLHILMHLHGYHNEQKQKSFWSNLTKISENNFYKTFLKYNTGKRFRSNYPGCVTIYYNSRAIARQVRSIYKAFVIKMGP